MLRYWSPNRVVRRLLERVGPQEEGRSLAQTAGGGPAKRGTKGGGFAAFWWKTLIYREERGGFSDLRQLDEVPGLTGKADGIGTALTVGDT